MKQEVQVPCFDLALLALLGGQEVQTASNECKPSVSILLFFKKKCKRCKIAETRARAREFKARGDTVSEREQLPNHHAARQHAGTHRAT
jgi:hypothetical protein